MIEEKREFPAWLKKWQEGEMIRSEELPESEVYGKGVSSLFSYTPKFNGDSPSYSVKHIDKELELYTLHEASNTLGITDLLKGLLTSPLLPESKTKLDALIRGNIKSGLVCYTQPKISDDGTLLEHNLSLETAMPNKGASDFLIIIAKTGSRLRISHEFVGGNDISMLGRQIIVVCEDGAMVNFNEEIKNIAGALSLQYLCLIGPSSNVTWSGVVTAPIMLKMHSSYYLLGAGANSELNQVCFAKNDSQYDIANTAYLKADSTHAIMHMAGVSQNNAHIIYRDGIISVEENKDSVDEAKILMVGDSSRVDALPVKDNNAIRHVVQSHLDNADDNTLKQFFGRIISEELLDKAMK